MDARIGPRQGCRGWGRIEAQFLSLIYASLLWTRLQLKKNEKQQQHWLILEPYGKHPPKKQMFPREIKIFRYLASSLLLVFLWIINLPSAKE
jgi:hypothetical protein